MSTIISVSITPQQKQFIDEMAISPSELLQDCINQQIESNKVSVKLLEELNRKIAVLREVIDKQRDFIESKGLMDDFIKL